ncbi:MAG: hypothetical protein EON54_14450 [Alcaligenaceae bacterium]|nr:MAG: hypothetical protein EON54_14450 [Alcaligenaceae bacterium]
MPATLNVGALRFQPPGRLFPETGTAGPPGIAGTSANATVLTPAPAAPMRSIMNLLMFTVKSRRATAVKGALPDAPRSARAAVAIPSATATTKAQRGVIEIPRSP